MTNRFQNLLSNYNLRRYKMGIARGGKYPSMTAHYEAGAYTGPLLNST